MDGNLGLAQGAATPARAPLARAATATTNRRRIPEKVVLHPPATARRPLPSRMRTLLRCIPLLLLAACGGNGTSVAAQAAPAALTLPDSTIILDGPTGAPVSSAELLRRIGAADFVLLGEYHDNARDHAARGALIRAAATRHPGLVFEQFARSDAALPLPAPGDSLEGWLDRSGFDRKGWQWPMHRPVIEAAVATRSAIWGSGLSRDTLRSVVRGGRDASPPALLAIMNRAPLDSAAQAAIDHELFVDHCGKLPANLMAGMRAAQEVRDASMTAALLAAAGKGPAWLIAGNGHVRSDMGVPRLLRAAAPGRRVLAVGFLERDSTGALPDTAERHRYQLVVVTPPAPREDPCAGL